MSENPDLKKIIDDMDLGNANISLLDKLFPWDYKNFQKVMTGVQQLQEGGEQVNNYREGLRQKLGARATGAVENFIQETTEYGEPGVIQADIDRTFNERDVRLPPEGVNRFRASVSSQSRTNSLTVNWRRFAPMMAEEGLTADRVFRALYHVNTAIDNPAASIIMDMHDDRPAMEAVMKVFEYADTSQTDQLYSGVLGAHGGGWDSSGAPGATNRTEYLGRNYNTEELKAAKKYWQTPMQPGDLSEWGQLLGGRGERQASAISYGLTHPIYPGDYLEYSPFARRALGDNFLYNPDEHLPGTTSIIPFFKGKNVPGVLKTEQAGRAAWQGYRRGFSTAAEDLLRVPSGGFITGAFDMGLAVQGEFGRTSMRTQSHPVGKAFLDFFATTSPELQDFLFKSPNSMGTIERGFLGFTDIVKKAPSKKTQTKVIENMAGKYGEALDHFFHTRGKNEGALSAGVQHIDDLATAWLDSLSALPVKRQMPETIDTPEWSLRKVTGDEAQVGCHAINIKYGGNFCVGNGLHVDKINRGEEFGYLAVAKETGEEIGFGLSEGNGFKDWGWRHENRVDETPFIAALREAFPVIPGEENQELNAFQEIYKRFFGKKEVDLNRKANEHVKGKVAEGVIGADPALSSGRTTERSFLAQESGRAMKRNLADEATPKFKITAQMLKRHLKVRGLGLGIGIGAGLAVAALPSLASAATGAPTAPSSLSGALITGAAIIGGAGAAVGTYKALQGLKAANSPSVLGSPMPPPGSVNRNYGSRIYNSGFIQNELDLTTRGFFAGIGSVINDFGLNRRIGGFDPSGKPSSFLDSFFGKALGSTGYVHPVYRAEEAFWQVANNLDDAYQGWKNYISTSYSSSSGIAKFFHGARYHGFKLLDQVGDGWLNKQLVKMGGLSTMIAPALMAHGAIGDFRSGYRQAGIVGGIGNTALGIGTGLIQNKVIAGALLNPMVGLTGAAVAAAAGYTAFKIFDVRNQGAQYIRSGRMGGISWNRGPTPGMSSSMGASMRQRSINAMENSRFSAMKAIGNESYMMSAPKARYSGSTAIYGTSSVLSY